MTGTIKKQPYGNSIAQIVRHLSQRWWCVQGAGAGALSIYLHDKIVLYGAAAFSSRPQQGITQPGKVIQGLCALMMNLGAGSAHHCEWLLDMPGVVARTLHVQAW